MATKRPHNKLKDFTTHNFYGATLGSWASVHAENEDQARELLRVKLELRKGEDFKLGTI